MAKEHVRKGAVALLGGALFALLIALGQEAERLMARDPLAASDPRRLLKTAALLLVPAALLLAALFGADERMAHKSPAAQGRPFSARRAFAGIVLCYVPMFVIAFPGSFAYDVPFQLEQVFTGAYSSHHPLLHTLVMGGCVALGKLVGHVNLGAALYTALQAAGLAGCFSLTCASLSRQCGLRAARRAAVFFALYPLHMVFAVNATKDVLFSGLFALTLALAGEALTRGLTRREGARLCACAALMLMLRNNAVYALGVWLLALLLLLRGKGLRTAGVLCLGAVLALGANGLLSFATGARKGDLCEMLSWPIQQLARARVTQEERLTDEEIAAVDALMPGESWRLYDPLISDPVKFEFDTQALLDNPAHYWQAYLSIGRKCPQAYFDALLLHTYSFLYPYGTYRVPGAYAQMSVGTDYYDGWWQGERIESAFPRLLFALQWRFGAKGAMQVPVVGYLFNMGLIIWAMLYFALREMYEGRRAGLALALLPVLLWGTYLLGPVMAGRYIYPFVCAMPVLALRPGAPSGRNSEAECRDYVSSPEVG